MHSNNDRRRVWQHKLLGVLLEVRASGRAPRFAIGSGHAIWRNCRSGCLGTLMSANLLAGCSKEEPATSSVQDNVVCRVEGDTAHLPNFRIGIVSREDDSHRRVPGRLAVRHQASGDKELFASRDGRGFLAIAKATLSAPENRGAFAVEEKIGARCDVQTIDEISCRASAFVIRGKLSGAADGGCSVDYELSFEERSPGRLAFDVSLGDTGYDYIELTAESSADEGFYGFGEQFTYPDLKGQKVPILSQEQGVGRGNPAVSPIMDAYSPGTGGTALTTSASVPQYLTTEGKSLFLENTQFSVFDLTTPTEVVIRLFAKRMTGGILYGKDPLELIERYTEYAGRMPELPSWVHDGAIVGMQGGTSVVRAVLDKLKAKGTPVTAFWLQDWVGKRTTVLGSQLWWNWELDTKTYPEWPALVRDLRASGARVLGYINPYLVDATEKEDMQRNLYKEAASAGYLVLGPSGKAYETTNSDFGAGLVDLTNPEARVWIKGIMKDMLTNVGFSGWMADFGEALPFEGVLHSGQAASEYHNQYPVDWAATNREALREAGAEGEAIFYSRSGYTRSPGASTLFWLGDQTVTWDENDGLRSAIVGLMGGGISGFSVNHSDIGGYFTFAALDLRRSKELLLRWMEVAAFTSVFRSHEGNQPLENAQVYTDDETLDGFTRLAKVYRALRSYRVGLVKEASLRGIPVVRHPWLHFPNDPELRRLQVNELQFMLGSDVLVAPVLEPGVTKRRVYLPAGRWVHLFRGDSYGDAARGGYYDVEAPIGTPPALVRAESPTESTLREALRVEGVTQ